MTPDNARNAASKFADTWPGRIRVEIWTEVLEHYDVNEARETYRHLRDTSEHAPTIAAFKTQHRLLHPHGERTEGRRTECNLCGGTGWDEITVQRPNYPTPTVGVAPCRCSNGNANRAVHAKILEDLDRATPDPMFRAGNPPNVVPIRTGEPA